MPLILESSAFAEKFDVEPFGFGHGLAQHPLFSIDRLARLTDTMLARGPADCFMHVDGAGWPSGSFDAAARERSADIVRHLERPGAWIKLTSPQEVDGEYRHF